MAFVTKGELVGKQTMFPSRHLLLSTSGRVGGKHGSHRVLEGRKKRLIVRPRVRAESQTCPARDIWECPVEQDRMCKKAVEMKL